MKETRTSSARKKPPRESMSVRIAPQLKQLLKDSAAAHGLSPARWIERLLWESKEVQERLIQGSSPSDLLVSMPAHLYTLNEITLAHLTLLARATHHLEEIARVVDRCRRGSQFVDELRLADTLHAVANQLNRLTPLHVRRQTLATTGKVMAEFTP